MFIYLYIYVFKSIYLNNQFKIKKFSGRCLNKIKMISNEIVTTEELEQTEEAEGDANVQQ